MGRLDFFLVSETLIQFSYDEDISHGYRSDHSLISISLQFNKSPQGKTFWKFNSSLLTNIEFVKEVKEVILNVKKQYAASPYNLENIEQIPNNLFQSIINPQLFFDVLLLEIRNKIISFSSGLRKKERNQEQELESLIIRLESSDPEGNFEFIKSNQNKLQELREKKLRGSLIRSRARWVENGEKASKYFCNLENRNFISKRMTSVINSKGQEVEDFNAINNEVCNFYKKFVFK